VYKRIICIIVYICIRFAVNNCNIKSGRPTCTHTTKYACNDIITEYKKSERSLVDVNKFTFSRHIYGVLFSYNFKSDIIYSVLNVLKTMNVLHYFYVYCLLNHRIYEINIYCWDSITMAEIFLNSTMLSV
jgi:hypothetical protein